MKFRRNSVQLTWPPTSTAALTTSEAVARVDEVTTSKVTNAPSRRSSRPRRSGIGPADGRQRHGRAAGPREGLPHHLGRDMRRNRRQQPGGHGAGQRTRATAARPNWSRASSAMAARIPPRPSLPLLTVTARIEPTSAAFPPAARTAAPGDIAAAASATEPETPSRSSPTALHAAPREHGEQDTADVHPVPYGLAIVEALAAALSHSHSPIRLAASRARSQLGRSAARLATRQPAPHGARRRRTAAAGLPTLRSARSRRTGRRAHPSPTRRVRSATASSTQGSRTRDLRSWGRQLSMPPLPGLGRFQMNPS